MKSTFERSLFQNFIFACISILLLLIAASCQKDAVDDTTTKIVGTWHQTFLTKDGINSVKDSSRLILQINSDNICVLCDSSAVAIKSKTIVIRSGWSYTGSLLNIAIDLPVSWKPVVYGNTLSMERIDFNRTGAIIKTTLNFERIANIYFK